VYAFFWVILRRLILYGDVPEHSACSIFIGGESKKINRDEIIPAYTAYKDGTDRVFRNVEI
jgi:hypothetical protein